MTSPNGQLRPDELTPIQGQFLANATAHAFNAMSEASWEANHVRLLISPGGAYRDLAAQQYLIDHPQGPVPIAPLGYSTHGDGRAVDISNYWAVYGWLVNHAHEFGFRQQFASERWHWKHDGVTAAGTGTPIVAASQRGTIDMPELYGTTMPAAPVAKKFLDVNAGLAPGKPTYMLLGGSPGTPFNAKITQDQVVASQWAKQLAPSLENPSSVIVSASWAWAEQLWDGATAPLSIAGFAGGDQKPVLDAIAAVSDQVEKIPAAAENGAAARAAIIKEP